MSKINKSQLCQLIWQSQSCLQARTRQNCTIHLNYVTAVSLAPASVPVVQ